MYNQLRHKGEGSCRWIEAVCMGANYKKTHSRETERGFVMVGFINQKLNVTRLKKKD